MGSIYKNGIAYTSGGGGGASDSGWLELDGTAAVNPDYKFYYRKVGAFVFVQAQFRLASSMSTSQTATLFTLPDGFRPKFTASVTLRSLGSYNVLTDVTTSAVSIQEDGVCTVRTIQASLGTSTMYTIDVAFVSA